MRRVCTICARGGSKGVKNKNTRELLGKPLLAYSVERARESGLFEYIAVSSDSDEILRIAKEYGADFLIRRPEDLATDKAAKVPAIRHCAQEAEKLSGHIFDTCVDLDATSPLRLVEDIRGSVELLESRQVSNVITGAPARRSPYFNLVETDPNGVVSLSKPLPVAIECRQDAPKCYDMNASIYVWQRDILMNHDTLFHHDTLLFEMPEERSPDIDSEIDFRWVEFLLKERQL